MPLDWCTGCHLHDGDRYDIVHFQFSDFSESWRLQSGRSSDAVVPGIVIKVPTFPNHHSYCPCLSPHCLNSRESRCQLHQSACRHLCRHRPVALPVGVAVILLQSFLLRLDCWSSLLRPGTFHLRLHLRAWAHPRGCRRSHRRRGYYCRSCHHRHW